MDENIVLSDLTVTANDSKKLSASVKSFILKYGTIQEGLHTHACMVLYHTANYGECSQMNAFFKGLNTNDRVAFKNWVGKHSRYVRPDGVVASWMKFATKPVDKKGNATENFFSVLSGQEAFRKDRFEVDMEVEDRVTLMNEQPFTQRDIRIPAEWDLEKALKTLKTALTKVQTESEKNGINLPAEISKEMTLMSVTVTTEIAKLPAKPANQSNDNVPVVPEQKTA